MTPGLGILVWTMLLGPLPGPRHEVLWLALTRIGVAGFPTSLAVDALAPLLRQARAGSMLYVLLLVAVVLNWALIGTIDVVGFERFSG